MAKNSTWTLTGNTYPHRDAIKAVGGKWDADAKCWVVKAGTVRERAAQSSLIYSLRQQGVTVTER